MTRRLPPSIRDRPQRPRHSAPTLVVIAAVAAAWTAERYVTMTMTDRSLVARAFAVAWLRDSARGSALRLLGTGTATAAALASDVRSWLRKEEPSRLGPADLVLVRFERLIGES